MMYVKENVKTEIKKSIKELAEQIGFQKAAEIVGLTMTEYVSMNVK